jgi:hypothetical protein
VGLVLSSEIHFVIESDSWFIVVVAIFSLLTIRKETDFREGLKVELEVILLKIVLIISTGNNSSV